MGALILPIVLVMDNNQLQCISNVPVAQRKKRPTTDPGIHDSNPNSD